MRKYIIFVILLVLILSGCHTEKELNINDSYTFTDSSNHEITVSKNPQQTAILFSSFADIWICAGGTVQITVGESVERGFAEKNAILVDDGSGHTTVNMEVLIASKPDFVIGTTDYECQKEAVDFTRTQGIPSASFQVETFDDYLKVLEIFCNITERPDLYKQNGTAVKNRIDEILSQNKDIAQGKKILFVRAGSTAKSTKAKNTSQHFVCGMLADLGTINIADSAEILLDGLSLEAVVKADPDHLFISLMGNAQASEEYVKALLESSGWKDLRCVKNGNYTFLPKELFHYKPNSKWDIAYQYLIDIFKDHNED